MKLFEYGIYIMWYLLYMCQAENTVGKEQHESTMEEMTIAAGLNPEENLYWLHTRIEITAMVMINILTEADLANGTRGVVTNTIREQPDKSEIENGIFMLMYPPAMIIFNPVESTLPKFDGLDEGEIPLFPSEHNFQISTLSR